MAKEFVVNEKIFKVDRVKFVFSQMPCYIYNAYLHYSGLERDRMSIACIAVSILVVIRYFIRYPMIKNIFHVRKNFVLLGYSLLGGAYLCIYFYSITPSAKMLFGKDISRELKDYVKRLDSYQNTLVQNFADQYEKYSPDKRKKAMDEFLKRGETVRPVVAEMLRTNSKLLQEDLLRVLDKSGGTTYSMQYHVPLSHEEIEMIKEEVGKRHKNIVFMEKHARKDELK